VLFLVAALNVASGGKKAPKLAETIDLPPTLDVDFQFAAKRRVELGAQTEVPNDIAGRAWPYSEDFRPRPVRALTPGCTGSFGLI
jgi:hypothetical protein